MFLKINQLPRTKLSGKQLKITLRAVLKIFILVEVEVETLETASRKTEVKVKKIE